MYAVTKFLAQKNRISQILVIVLKNRSNEIRSNEIRIRRELPVHVNPAILKSLHSDFPAKTP